MSEQSKAIELADTLENGNDYEKSFFDKECASELRRLHEENAALRAQFASKDGEWFTCPVCEESTKLLAAPQQAPVDEREAFELEMRCEEKWGHRSLARHNSGGYKNSWVACMWEIWQARAALKPAVPEGYQLVPIEPTDEMSTRGILEALRDTATIPDIYQAMLAAAKDGEA